MKKEWFSIIQKPVFVILARHTIVIFGFLFTLFYTQSLSLVFYCWPVTLIILGNLILSFDYNFFLNKKVFNAKHLLAIAPFLITILIVIWGVVMTHDLQSNEPAPKWPTYVIWVLLCLHIPTSVSLIRKMKGLRWYVTSLGLFQIWCSLSASSIAAMSVTGDWL